MPNQVSVDEKLSSLMDEWGAVYVACRNAREIDALRSCVIRNHSSERSPESIPDVSVYSSCFERGLDYAYRHFVISDGVWSEIDTTRGGAEVHGSEVDDLSGHVQHHAWTAGDCTYRVIGSNSECMLSIYVGDTSEIDGSNHSGTTRIDADSPEVLRSQYARSLEAHGYGGE